MSDASSDPVVPTSEQEPINIEKVSSNHDYDTDDEVNHQYDDDEEEEEDDENNETTIDEDHVRAAELLASMKDTPVTQYNPDDDYQHEPFEFEWDFEVEEGEIVEKKQNYASSDDNQDQSSDT